MRSAYLQHHGILGMKWGIRRFEDKNGRLTAAGKERYGKGGKREKSEDETKTKEKFWTEDRKAIAKKVAIGAGIVAGTCLVAYGGYKLHQSGKVEDMMILGRQKVTRLLNQNKGSGSLLGDIDEVSKATGFKVRETLISIEESSKVVNPGYKTGQKEYTENCFSAATADVINRLNDGKGLKVQARAATKDEIDYGGKSFNEVANVWKNTSIDDIIVKKESLKSVNEIKDNLTNQIKAYCKSETGIGIIRLRGVKNASQGHYIKFEISNGSVILSDSQSGTQSKVDRYLVSMLKGVYSRGVEILNVDGLELNPEQMKKFVNSL